MSTSLRRGNYLLVFQHCTLELFGRLWYHWKECLLNVGLSVLVFMRQSKKPICWLASNFWILLGVMLEAGIDCAKIAQHTIEVGG